jgi:hypothetical protein
MNPKAVVYLGLIFAALLTLALGGWIVKGAKTLAGQKREPSLRPRFA